MPRYFPTASFEQKIILTGIVTLTLYFFFGPLALAATTAALVLKKNNDIRYRRQLIERSIEAEDISALVELETQQINLNDHQKLTMLLNAYGQKNQALINHLYQQNFKIEFSRVCSVFKKNKDPILLKLLLDKFLNKYPIPHKQELASIIKELYADNLLNLIDALLLVYPEEVLAAIFMLMDKDVALSSGLWSFLNEKNAWLMANPQTVNYALENQTNKQLIRHLIAIFPKGELDLSRTIISLIDKSINNESLCDWLSYLNNKEKNEAYYKQIEAIIERALFHKKIDIVDQLLKNNPNFLSLRKEFSANLLLRFSSKIKVSELLLNYGADVNSTNSGLSILEQSIGSLYTPLHKKQRMLDIYMKHRVNLDLPLKDAPQKRTDMTLLGYLPFLNLRIANHADFEAIKLQKFLALFLEIPGISSSNGTICKHTDMQDSQAYWNFLLDLYFKHCASSPLMAALPALVVDNFNNCLKTLYSEEGKYNPETLYENYTQGKPVILPIYLHDGWGGSHIAVAGFIKTGTYSHLVVEADRGLGRHDFSVFEGPSFSYNEFSYYTRMRHAPMLVYKWQSHNSQAIFSIDLNAQKDNFCPAISAKYAINIALFLCILQKKFNKNKELFTNKSLQEMIKTSYELSDNWLKQFCNLAQNCMLNDYRNLPSKFINNHFLTLVKEAVAKDLSPKIAEIPLILREELPSIGFTV